MTVSRPGLLALAVLALSCALELGATTGVLSDEEFDPPRTFHVDDVLVLEGRNDSGARRVLVIRIDDRQSSSYASRANLERVLPPGKFHLRIPLGNLHTASHRRLDVSRVRRLIVFDGSGQGGLRLERKSIESGRSLPAGAFGWDLGAPSSATEEGFRQLSPGAPEVRGNHLVTIDRGTRSAAADPLTADGIGGIRDLNLPLPNGAWRVVLWTRDPGEWEYLPHPLRGSLSVNGMKVRHFELSPSEWIREVYLEGRSRETYSDSDPWEVVAGRRSGKVSVDTMVHDGFLRLEMSGDSPSATFVAGVLAVPRQSPSAVEEIERRRADRFRANWRVGPNVPRPADLIVDLAIPDAPSDTKSWAAAPGTSVGLEVEIKGNGRALAPTVVVIPPSQEGRSLPTELRFGHWRFGRPNASATELVSQDKHLRSDIGALEIDPGKYRRLNLRITIPEGTPPGPYSGNIQIAVGELVAVKRIFVEVLDVQLPTVDKPIGVYLDEAPHLSWFPELQAAVSAQHDCDLAYLRYLGLTGVAPALPTPVPGRERQFMQAVDGLSVRGFSSPFLAYTPWKRLLRAMDMGQAIDQMRRVSIATAADGVQRVAWSIADEPSGPTGISDDAVEAAKRIRGESEISLLAGQLNNPSDRALVGDLDIALVNHAFGADHADLVALRAMGAEPWLYNMRQPRMAAGFYLWRSGAQGYLQWHGRMPTADPFDPTDGREGDIQFFYPTEQVCPRVPDIDRDLLRLADGVNDLRWLRWLEQFAAIDLNAERLVDRLYREVPDTWASAELLSDQELQDWREQIIDLARRLAD